MRWSRSNRRTALSTYVARRRREPVAADRGVGTSPPGTSELEKQIGSAEAGLERALQEVHGRDGDGGEAVSTQGGLAEKQVPAYWTVAGRHRTALRPLSLSISGGGVFGGIIGHQRSNIMIMNTMWRHWLHHIIVIREPSAPGVRRPQGAFFVAIGACRRGDPTSGARGADLTSGGRSRSALRRCRG